MEKDMNLEAIKSSPVLYQLLSSLTKFKLPEISQLMFEINDDPDSDHSHKALNILKFEALRSFGEKDNKNSLISYEVVSLENPELKSYINIGKQDIGENIYKLKDEEHFYMEEDNEHLERIGDIVYSTSIYRNIYDAYDDYFDKITQYEHLINDEVSLKNSIQDELEINSNKNSVLDDEIIFNNDSIEQIVAKFKENNPESELVLKNENSPYYSERNDPLLEEISGIRPDNLAEFYDSVKEGTYSFLWNECVHLNEINGRDFSVADLWDNIPTNRQEEIVDALFNKIVLQNSHSAKLIEYKWKEEDDFGLEVKPIYQVKEDKALNNRSISTKSLIEAEDIYTDLKKVKKNRLTPF